jgi:hypothetical protein
VGHPIDQLQVMLGVHSSFAEILKSQRLGEKARYRLCTLSRTFKIFCLADAVPSVLPRAVPSVLPETSLVSPTARVSLQISL